MGKYSFVVMFLSGFGLFLAWYSGRLGFLSADNPEQKLLDARLDGLFVSDVANRRRRLEAHADEDRQLR